MYKLIVVDDETEVRRGIVKKIDFEAVGFECVGEAENGVEALEVIENTDPDLAIIDIKMPYMDGIELAKHVHEKHPAMSLIILSGFDEFEFAQKAIRYNVLEYVLKPISSAEIVTLLQRAKAQLDQERELKRDLLRLKSHYMESMPIIRERFLNALVLEKHSIMDLENKLERYGINLGIENFVVAVVRPDIKEPTDTEVNELYAYAVYETVKEICDPHQMTAFHNHSGHTVIIIDVDMTTNYMYWLEVIRAQVEKKHVHTVTIGLGEVVKSKGDISNSYDGAVMSLNYHLLEGNNKILWIRDLEPNRLEQMIFDVEIEAELNKVIRSYDLTGIDQVLLGVFEELQEKKVKIRDLKLYITELLLSLLKISRQYGLNLEWFKNNKDIFKAISQLKDFAELKEVVLEQSLLLSKTIQSTRKNTIRLLIEKAVVFINENYTDLNMSLETVAEHLHLSQEYLSRQFKKEMGETFIHYLTDVRLQEAKRLIEDTNCKNFEVAEIVGYNEPNYFSYSFKKHFGISPSQYRKSLKK